LRAAASSGMGAAELGYRRQDNAGDALLLRAALLEQPLAPDDLAVAEAAKRAKFPVAAADLQPEFSGPALGARLAELEARWIASGFTLSREQLLLT
ncbi:CCA tRNA nucleotidyltransferase, partial [Pseudooceanicola lipolyticus]